MELKELVQNSQDIKVLLVEDDKEVRMQLTKLLENFFTHLDVCNDGLEALYKYDEYKNKTNNFYDLIVTDISMPKLNGIELSKKILEKNPEQIILVITAHAHKFHEANSVGIENFLEKPIDYEKMLAVFTKIIKKLKDKK